MYKLYVDGSKKPNNHLGGCGIGVLILKDKKIICRKSFAIKEEFFKKYSVYTEIKAVIKGLKVVEALDIKEIEIYTDCESVKDWLNNKFSNKHIKVIKKLEDTLEKSKVKISKINNLNRNNPHIKIVNDLAIKGAKEDIKNMKNIKKKFKINEDFNYDFKKIINLLNENYKITSLKKELFEDGKIKTKIRLLKTNTKIGEIIIDSKILNKEILDIKISFKQIRKEHLKKVRKICLKGVN